MENNIEAWKLYENYDALCEIVSVFTGDREFELDAINYKGKDYIVLGVYEFDCPRYTLQESQEGGYSRIASSVFDNLPDALAYLAQVTTAHLQATRGDNWQA